MSLWQDYLTRKLIFENHPSVDEKRCLNHMQTRHPCKACIDACPEGVFSMPSPGSPETDWDACTGCGLCVAACPSRAILPARLQAEKLYPFASQYLHHTIISCKSGNGADLMVEYPGALPWEFLCLLALQGTVTLVTGSCEDCEKKSCRQALNRTLSQARLFLGDRLFRERIHTAAESPSAAPRSYTRREAVSIFLKRTGRTASTLLPLPQDSVPDGTLWRQLLLYRVKKLSEKAGKKGPTGEHTESERAGKEGPTGEYTESGRAGKEGPTGEYTESGRAGKEGPTGEYIEKDSQTRKPSAPSLLSDLGWMLPRFADSCTACGICTRMCPAGALLRAPGPPGSGRFYMALLPHKCTGCGLCSQVCPVDGMLAPSPVHLDSVDRPILSAIAAKPCRRCQEPVPAGSESDLCSRCRAETGL